MREYQKQSGTSKRFDFRPGNQNMMRAQLRALASLIWDAHQQKRRQDAAQDAPRKSTRTTAEMKGIQRTDPSNTDK